jgi:hypothetical protein
MNSIVDIKIPIFSFGFNITDIMKYVKLQLFNTDRCSAKFGKVLEPFKVRGITAGNCPIYQLGRMIQPVLHGCLRNEDGPFRFIGKRHNEEDINNVYAGTVFVTESNRKFPDSWEDFDKKPIGACWGSKTFFVAGDYKNATDNMHPILPKTYVEALAEFTDIHCDWVSVLKKTLAGHKLYYPELPEWYSKIIASDPDCNWIKVKYDVFRGYRLEVEQIHGQLMGSPCSFPVLNIVNAAMFWVGCEEFYRYSMKWTDVLNEFRPLFNGDDISFISNSDHYRIWKEVCAGCGLSLSPGKNYCTRDFVNINSTNFRANLIQVDNMFVVTSLKESFVVNAGLLKGQSKVLLDERDEGKIPDTGLGPICDQLKELMRVASGEQRERIIEVFQYNMMKKLKQSSRSWRLPRHLGGLGLPFGTVNYSQLEVALQQLENYQDVGDHRTKGEFVFQANEYWKSIKESLPEGIKIQTPCVLIADTEDPTKDFHELPCLSMSFMTDRDYDPGNYNGKKKKGPKRPNPERKFLRLKRKFNFKDPKSLVRREQASIDDDVLITNLEQTFLSGSGSNKRLRVDVCIPRVEIFDVVKEEFSLCCRGNTLDLNSNFPTSF